MTDSSNDPKKRLDLTADRLADPTNGEGTLPPVGDDIWKTEQANGNLDLDTIARTLVPDQQDLFQTLPQTTLRPKTLPATFDKSATASVQPRSLRAADKDASTSGDHPAAPDDKADYVTMQVIGQGGMGTVLLARQVALGRAVAVKQIRADHSQHAFIQNEFLTEAVLTGRLEHPNIVPIYEVGRSSDGSIFYSMKNIKGQAWSETIGNRSLEENLDILVNVCDAIAFAHSEGVIHRDLKPQNIMTGGFGEVLVLDWGLALAMHPQMDVTSFAGTPAFMAPEMVNPPFAVGPHSDIYLLGANLFMILSGNPPHGGASAHDCLLAALQNIIQVPDEARLRRLDPSGELLGVARRAMATQPEDRYPTVSAFQQAIRDYLSHRESLELSARSQQALESAQVQSDYSQYSRAIFGFEEAYKLWNQNVQAQEGVAQARLAWAKCAEDQSDFDLALSLLDESIAEQQEIRVRVSAARNERDARQSHVRMLRRFSVAAGILILIGAVGFGVYQRRVTETLAKQRDTISQQFDSITIAQKKTLLALDAEKTAKQLAEQARESAIQAEKKAVQAAQLAEHAEKIAVQEREATRVALVAESNAKTLAEQQRESAERQLYINQIQSSLREWEINSPATSEKHLVATQERFRAWEYRYLRTLFGWNHQTLTAHNSYIVSVAFSLDGTRIASGGRNGTIKLWDASNGDEVLAIKGHEASFFNLLGKTPTNTVNSIAFSPDGKRIASASLDQTIKLWDAQTGDEISTFSGHQGSVNSVSFSPDGNRLVSCSHDKTIKVWNAISGEPIRTLEGHTVKVLSAVFSPDGTRIASCDDAGVVKLWDSDTGKVQFSGKDSTRKSNMVAFSPDGERIACCNSDGKINLWDTSTGKQVMTLAGHQLPVFAVAFNPEGTRIVSGGLDKTLMVWDASTGESILSLTGHSKPINSVAFSPDGNRILSGSDDATLKLWDIKAGRQSLVSEDRIQSLAFTPDSSRIISVNALSNLSFWDADSGELKSKHHGNIGQFYSIAVNPKANQIACSGMSGIELRSLDSAKVLFTLTEHTGGVDDVDYSPDGNHLVSVGHDGNIKRWDIQTGKQTSTQKGHAGKINCVAFSSDGKQIASAGEYGILKLWDADTRAETRAIIAHAGSVKSLAFSPDDTRIVTSGWDRTLRVWDTTTGNQVFVIGPDSFIVNSLAFSPDGSRIVGGCEDSTVKLWDATNGLEVLTLNGHIDQVTAVAFTPDGSRIVSGTRDAEIKLWDASGDSAFSRAQRADASEPLDVTASHEYRASLGEDTGDWYAAAFHLGRLVALRPGDASLQERQAAANARLRELGQPAPGLH